MAEKHKWGKQGNLFPRIVAVRPKVFPVGTMGKTQI